MADKKDEKLKLTLVTPTAEGIATMVERLTGKRPSPEKMKEIQAELDARAAKP